MKKITLTTIFLWIAAIAYAGVGPKSNSRTARSTLALPPEERS